MNKVIHVGIRDKIAAQTDKTVYVCGNSDYTVKFDFDAEWDEFEAKTARFIAGGSYTDVVFTGNVCDVPVIENTYIIKVGVFAGNLQTTTPAVISSKKSILCENGTPAPPTEDVYNQIMEKIGELQADVPQEQIASAVAEYLEENPVGGGTPVEIDDTLTQSGQAADAKATGDALNALNEAIDALAVSGLTPAQISALDGMFKVAAYIKSDVSAEYNAFKTAFGIEDSGEEPEEPGTPEVTLTSISATYSGGDVAVGTAVTDLSGIVVTAHYSDGSAEVVTGYTLSGAIADGENIITVSYGGETTTFTVTGVTESDGVYVPELVWTDGQRINGANGALTNAENWSVCQLIDISDYTRIHVTTTSTGWFSASVNVGTNENPNTTLKNGTSYWGGSYMTDETFDISNYSYLRIESVTNYRNTFTVELS